MIEKYKFGIIWICFCACVPLDQQRTINTDESQALTTDYILFQKVLSPTAEISDLPEPITPEVLRESDYQSHLDISGYGTIRAGKLISGGHGQSIKIIQDYLVIPISISGGYPLGKLTQSDLIWNSEYYYDEDGNLAVDLIISFKHLSILRARINTELVFDISALKNSESNSIVINILGYNYKTIYNY